MSSVLNRIRYGFGSLALKMQRIKARGRSVSPLGWRGDILAPPLKIGVFTKEIVARHYLEGRYVEGVKPVAWVTSGAPVEMLKALGFYVLYPENHAALCGVRRVVGEISQEAEKVGYSSDLCSYARTDLGMVISGKTPVGRLPKPDLLLACTNICQTVLFWYKVLSEHYRVPLVVVDTPFVYDRVGEHSVEYVKRQIEGIIPVAERVSRRELKFSKLREVLELSKKAAELWLEIIRRGKYKPAPISVFDQFIHMAPIVEMRGDVVTVDFYHRMLSEIDERIKNGVGTVLRERKRLLWDNLPIWYRLRFLSEFLAERGISVVVSTYTNAWGELAPIMDPDRPIESMARAYIHPILNRGTGHKLDTMMRMVKEYDLDGVILHSDRSCKPYSIGQVDQRNRLAEIIPSLILEADHSDPRSYSEEQVLARLSAFVEVLGD